MISKFFIERPVLSNVIAILMILIGGVSLFNLAVAQYPDVVPPTVQVTTRYPGASAKTVIDTVALPIEQQVNGVEDMIYMQSYSGADGTYSLTVTFKIGTDLNFAQVLVQNRVSAALSQLPQSVQSQGVTVQKKSTSILLFVTLTSPKATYDSLFLSNYATLRVKDTLSRIYGVSRMTSRQALQALKSLGLVSRQKGHGSFVSHPRVEKDIAHLVGFTAEMRALGMKASSRVLASETTSAKPEVAAKLAISVNASIYQLRRLRLSDGLPVAIEEICLPSGRFPGVDQLDFSRLSLYETLRDRYGIRLSRADEIIEARSATNREAQLLEIHPRASLLVISRTLWSTDGVPVETAHSVYRGDRYRAVLRIPATELE